MTVMVVGDRISVSALQEDFSKIRATLYGFKTYYNARLYIESSRIGKGLLQVRMDKFLLGAVCFKGLPELVRRLGEAKDNLATNTDGVLFLTESQPIFETLVEYDVLTLDVYLHARLDSTEGIYRIKKGTEIKYAVLVMQGEVAKWEFPANGRVTVPRQPVSNG